MREVVFVRRHADAWRDFETRLDAPETPDPDALAEGYVRLGDDLAYAKTFYPGSATAAYLNDLSAETHGRIYRNRREERGRLLRFWAEEVPRAVWRSRRSMIAAVLVFGLAVAAGVASAIGDDGFVRLILGDGYVNMTLDNIEDDDPFRVYKEMRQDDMTAYIGLNNIMVSFFAFIGVIQELGLPAAWVGTAWALIRNGVMVGAFAHLFGAEGLIGEWFRVVFIHGMLELTAIALAGGAGFTMWSGLLLPGTYPRMTAFRRSAVRGLKIIIGLVPVFVAAALLEGFVTRLTGMPLWGSALVIGGSAAFLLWYFVVLPVRIGRRDAAPSPAA